MIAKKVRKRSNLKIKANQENSLFKVRLKVVDLTKVLKMRSRRHSNSVDGVTPQRTSTPFSIATRETRNLKTTSHQPLTIVS